MSENGQIEKKSRLVPFQDELKLLGHWFKLECPNSKGQWARQQHLYSNTLILLKACPLFTTHTLFL